MDDKPVGFISGPGVKPGGWFRCSWLGDEKFPLVVIPEEEMCLPDDVPTFEVGERDSGEERP